MLGLKVWARVSITVSLKITLIWFLHSIDCPRLGPTEGKGRLYNGYKTSSDSFQYKQWGGGGGEIIVECIFCLLL